MKNDYVELGKWALFYVFLNCSVFTVFETDSLRLNYLKKRSFFNGNSQFLTVIDYRLPVKFTVNKSEISVVFDFKFLLLCMMYPASKILTIQHLMLLS